jgi:iron complex outermembrane receptor protein
MKLDRSLSAPVHLRPCKTAHSVLLACLSMGGALGASPSLAQTAPAPAAAASAAASDAPTNLGKIIVTARKREELLIDVPISMLVYSDKELRDSGTTDLQSLSGSAGFQLQQSTLGSTVASGRTLGTISFRGLQPSDAAPRSQSGSLFIDGIFISGGPSTVNMVGVQRAEVLKGPQNTYFGRSTFGGAINLITKNPPTTFGGEVNASVTGRGSSDTDGTIGGPLGSDAVRGSVTVFNHIKAAQYHATDGGDLGAEKTTGATGTIYLTPTDKLWLRFRGHYQRDDDSAAQLGYIRGDVYGTNCAGQTYSGKNNAGAPITYTPTVKYFCGTVPSSGQVGLGNVLDANTALLPIEVGPFVNNSLGDPIQGDTPTLTHSGLRRDTSRLSAQGAYELPYAATLGFSLGYNQVASRSIWDLDRSATPNFGNSLQIVANDLTADVRVSSDPAKSVRGLLGLSYFHSSYKLTQIDYNAYAGLAPNLNVSNSSNDTAQVPAIYGSLDYDILPNLTATVEARYQRDKASTIARTTGIEYSQSFNNVLPRVSIQYKPIVDTDIYASWSKGVQPTSFNSGIVNATQAQKDYIASVSSGSAIFTPQPSIRNMELGIKQSLLDGKLQYSLAAYQIDWENQVTLSAVFNSAACIAAGTFNTPACPLSASGSFVLLPNTARIRGLEFSTLANVNANWNLGLNLDYKDAKWISYYDSGQGGFTGGATRFDGNTLTRVPKISGALNATFTAPLVGAWAWYTRGDVTYQGKTFADNENIAEIEGYARANLRVGARTKDTTIELFVKNLFDDKHWDSGYKLTDLAASPLTSFSKQGIAVYAPDRREIGVRLRQTF